MLAFVIVMLLSLVVLYLCVTACFAVGSFSYAVYTESVSLEHRELLQAFISGLPAEIYGSPPQVFSWRPILLVVGSLALVLLFLSFLKTVWLYIRGGAYVAKKWVGCS